MRPVFPALFILCASLAAPATYADNDFQPQGKISDYEVANFGIDLGWTGNQSGAPPITTMVWNLSWRSFHLIQESSVLPYLLYDVLSFGNSEATSWTTGAALTPSCYICFDFDYAIPDFGPGKIEFGLRGTAQLFGLDEHRTAYTGPSPSGEANSGGWAYGANLGYQAVLGGVFLNPIASVLKLKDGNGSGTGFLFRTYIEYRLGLGKNIDWMPYGEVAYDSYVLTGTQPGYTHRSSSGAGARLGISLAY